MSVDFESIALSEISTGKEIPYLKHESRVCFANVAATSFGKLKTSYEIFHSYLINIKREILFRTICPMYVWKINSIYINESNFL